MVPRGLLGGDSLDEFMYFLLSYFLSELLVLLLGDSLVFHSLEELLYVVQAFLTGVVRIEGSVKVRDGGLGVELACVLYLGGAAISILSLSDDLSDCALPGRWTRELVLYLSGFELGFVSSDFDFI